MNNNIVIKDNTHFIVYLRANKIDTEKYIFNEKNPEKNIYGIRNLSLFLNPYLWNRIGNKRLYPAIEYAINEHPEWINLATGLGIIQAFQENSDNAKANIILDRILHMLWLSQDATENANNIDTVLLSILQYERSPLSYLKKLISFIQEHEIQLNPKGAFIKTSLIELAKKNDRETIDYILDLYPESFEESNSWPYVTALKHGNYELALFFARKGMNIHVKNDLGYKLLERNYKKNSSVRVGKNKKAEEELMDMYSKDEQHSNKT